VRKILWLRINWHNDRNKTRLAISRILNTKSPLILLIPNTRNIISKKSFVFISYEIRY